ncbi:alpha/beta fold hydrolase [Tundrisphaera lichenicola]|uniref:alpha/beta fold hydrolase n=1 Tax=Tundrisphaera lichenicola TaxID=2029860 RepID=UPI003EB891A8
MRKILSLLILVVSTSPVIAGLPEPTQADHVISDFRFASGEILPNLRIHYRTLGTPRLGEDGKVNNAVLILHGTTGSGANFFRPEFAGELFGDGQPLDSNRNYLIFPDGIGHGGSSKPSDGLHARFPRYGYRDMVLAQYRLLIEGLKIDHLRLVMGTSMGGMHTWLWGETYPDFMDALLPLASLPTQISGRNRAWRRVIIDVIRNDPAWASGDYLDQPPSLKTAAEMLYLMSNNPIVRQMEAPTRELADRVLEEFVARTVNASDANDVLYALESSSDYDPSPALEQIKAPLLAINFEDDLINPPELGILEREIRRVKRGNALVLPRSDRTRGHGTHTLAAIWKEHLTTLLSESITAGNSSISGPLPGLHLLQGPWDGGTIHRESVLFCGATKSSPTARLLFDVERVLSVKSADGSRSFEEGRDYQLAPDGSALILPPGSRIPSLSESDLFLPKGAPHSIGHRAGDPQTSLFFDNCHYFHDQQVEVSYLPRSAMWDGYRPSFAGDRLARTSGKLKLKQPLTIAVSGDSISEGYNASEFTKAPPFQASYPGLVAAQLEATSGSPVTLRNLAVGGWSSRQGLNDMDRLLATEADLIIIAYGMNDVGARDPKSFRSNIEAMLRRIREAKPETEVILVSTMTGNPDWMATPPEMFPIYRDVLAALEGPGVVLADMTSIWLELMRRKRHIDFTGNGVNHPNDYGHRVYAQAILAMLVDPTSVPKATAKDRR